MGELAGQPNLFIEKIWASQMPDSLSAMELSGVLAKYSVFSVAHRSLFGEAFKTTDVTEKLHTIRAGQRWKVGMKIHPVINNRTKNRFQFAPVMECVSVQDIEIIWADYGDLIGRHAKVYIDKTKYMGAFEEGFGIWTSPNRLEGLKQLAKNDGFDTTTQFFKYFNESFSGQIIHWTDLKY